jgi:hypothetical protein
LSKNERAVSHCFGCTPLDTAKQNADLTAVRIECAPLNSSLALSGFEE